MSIAVREISSSEAGRERPGSFPFSDDELHAAVIARISDGAHQHLAAVMAVEEGKEGRRPVPLLDVAVENGDSIRYPALARNVGLLAVEEFAPVTYPAKNGETVDAEDILRFSLHRGVASLDWTPASAVISVLKGRQAWIAAMFPRQ